MLETLARDFRANAPAVDFCALRFMEESSELLTVRQDVAEPPQLWTDRGAMVTVIDKGGLGAFYTLGGAGSGSGFLFSVSGRANLRRATASESSRHRPGRRVPVELKSAGNRKQEHAPRTHLPRGVLRTPCRREEAPSFPTEAPMVAALARDVGGEEGAREEAAVIGATKSGAGWG